MSSAETVGFLGGGLGIGSGLEPVGRWGRGSGSCSSRGGGDGAGSSRVARFNNVSMSCGLSFWRSSRCSSSISSALIDASRASFSSLILCRSERSSGTAEAAAVWARCLNLDGFLGMRFLCAGKPVVLVVLGGSAGAVGVDVVGFSTMSPMKLITGGKAADSLMEVSSSRPSRSRENFSPGMFMVNCGSGVVVGWRELSLM